MEFNSEILACYIDGTATEEERNVVREYLRNNPKCYEQMLDLIERTKDTSLVEEDTDCINVYESSKVNISHKKFSFFPRATSSQAGCGNSQFVSHSIKMDKECKSFNDYQDDVILSRQVKLRTNNLNEQMLGMLEELDNIEF